MPDLSFRDARPGDLPFILTLLRDDSVTVTPDDPARAGDPAYRDAFAAIASDPNQMLLVAEEDGRPVGTFQLTFTPGLARLGAWRATIEAVHVVPDRRSAGIGGAMIRHALDLARTRGCAIAQLTSNKARTRAHAFYERLGFVRTHESFKYDLTK